jgi:uncharacterized protein YqeY
MWRDKIKQEAVEALKSGDKRGLQLPPDGMTEVEELNVLRKELRNKEEARGMFLKAGRNDLVEQQDYEIEVVKTYLPKELDEVELKKIVDEVVAEKGKIFGAVMGETMKRVAGKANGDQVSKIVRELLN